MAMAMVRLTNRLTVRSTIRGSFVPDSCNLFGSFALGLCTFPGLSLDRDLPIHFRLFLSLGNLRISARINKPGRRVHPELGSNRIDSTAIGRRLGTKKAI